MITIHFCSDPTCNRYPVLGTIIEERHQQAGMCPEEGNQDGARFENQDLSGSVEGAAYAFSEEEKVKR